MKKNSGKVRNMILSSIFAAVMCIFSVMTIPVGAVPVSMGIFALVLTSCVLPVGQATAAVAVYVLLGAVGLPVFSGFRGGLAVLVGPTGGYIVAYIPAAAVISYFSNRYARSSRTAEIASVVFAILLCYALGTVQYMAVTNTSAAEAVMVCVAPFCVFDVIKCAAAMYAARKIRRAVRR